MLADISTVGQVPECCTGGFRRYTKNCTPVKECNSLRYTYGSQTANATHFCVVQKTEISFNQLRQHLYNASQCRAQVTPKLPCADFCQAVVWR